MVAKEGECVHIHIPLWLCLAGGLAIVIGIGTAVAVIVAVGVADADQALDTTLWKTYPVPGDVREPRQDEA